MKINNSVTGHRNKPVSHLPRMKFVVRATSLTSNGHKTISHGFTLIELIIVLVIMVGALAIAWPNLQKPLGRVKLDEASQTLREAIDESRHQAIRQNKSILIRLRKGATEVQSGSIDTFAERIGNEAGSSLGTSGRSQSNSATRKVSSGAEPQIWKLPDDVVVVNVERTDQRQASDVVMDGSTSSLGTVTSVEDKAKVESARRESSEPYVAPEDLSLESDLGESDKEWWVPLNAMGVGSDAKITLLDKSTKKTIFVSYSSTTGGLEISR
jgi:prepilin-type N-terminal cleavage/methylation domain-containing protein